MKIAIICRTQREVAYIRRDIRNKLSQWVVDSIQFITDEYGLDGERFDIIAIVRFPKYNSIMMERIIPQRLVPGGVKIQMDAAEDLAKAIKELIEKQ
jgi:pullulanase/glycogen debranching enzyme